jgi:hypothetical protein
LSNLLSAHKLSTFFKPRRTFLRSSSATSSFYPVPSVPTVPNVTTVPFFSCTHLRNSQHPVTTVPNVTTVPFFSCTHLRNSQHPVTTVPTVTTVPFFSCTHKWKLSLRAKVWCLRPVKNGPFFEDDILCSCSWDNNQRRSHKLCVP